MLAPTELKAMAEWKTKNGKIVSWLLDSVDKSIAVGLTPHKTTKAMWDHLKTIYKQSNEARLYRLEQELTHISQGAQTVQEFYNVIVAIWTEISMMDPEIPSSAIVTFQEMRERTQVRQFLMKLRPDFEHFRAALLNRSPLPSMNTVICDLLAKEQRLTALTSVPQPPGSSEMVLLASPLAPGKLSGDVPEEPVVSKKSGLLFEKRLIERHIADYGKCPITGEPQTWDDIVPVKTGKVVKPRPVQAASIPGMLGMFQIEWDGLMLSNFALEQQLQTARQELSHALYQDSQLPFIMDLIMARVSSWVSISPSVPARRMGTRQFRVEAKVLEIQGVKLCEGYALKITERSKWKASCSLWVPEEAIIWLSRTVKEFIDSSGYCFRKFRGRRCTLMGEKRSNDRDEFIVVQSFLGERVGGRVFISKGTRCYGWMALLSALGTDSRSLQSKPGGGTSGGLLQSRTVKRRGWIVKPKEGFKCRIEKARCVRMVVELDAGNVHNWDKAVVCSIGGPEEADDWGEVSRIINKLLPEEEEVYLFPFEERRAIYHAKQVSHIAVLCSSKPNPVGFRNVVGFRWWRPEANALSFTGFLKPRWLSVKGIPFHLWIPGVLGKVGALCGGLVEIHPSTVDLSDLSFA
ncbi:hypothetical protein HHK36_022480 [Tetracentron sinense]|uniref:Pre-mRNA-processing factor 19 n=1 Tax=Tetracentron sinense TaxID=13715 RepID=A0A834YT13_TETSI|nr:hypothetical protein HHK36_022480 [Tetracentron sinense]